MENETTTTETTLPDGVTIEEDNYGTDYTVLNLTDGSFPEIGLEYDDEAEADEDTGLKPVISVVQRFRSYGDEGKRAIRFPKRSFVQAFQSLLNQYMDMVRRGLLTSYDASAGYRVNPGYGGNSDLLSAAYVNRHERTVTIGGLRFVMSGPQFDTLLSKMQQVKTPTQRIEVGSTLEVRIDYSLSHTVEVEIDDVLDGEETWTDPETGIEYYLVEGTEDEVRDLLYEIDVEEELPDRTWEWDYFERENTEFESFPEITEHEASDEEDDEDE